MDPVASVSAASFSGDNKTLVVEGKLYAKKQAEVTLSVTTATAAKCVVVSGDHAATVTDKNGKTSWSIGFTAGDGNGPKSVTVNAYDNSGPPCTNPPGGTHTSMTASYILDNTGPSLSASLSPAPNGAGWNNNNSAVNITWDAVDAGVGFVRKCDGPGNEHNPKPCTDSQTVPTGGTTKSSNGTDRLGNSGSGSVAVRLDTAVPTISGSRSPAQPASGWNNTDVTVNFTCDDPKQGVAKDNAGFASGIKSCGPNQTLTTDGANQSVAGKAVDAADNEASATVESINIDKTPPAVTAKATTGPNGDGWYNGDVTIAWTCVDAVSGLASACPANSTISSEGENLGATSPSVSDKAGNAGSGSISGIKIDRTAPKTTATAPATDWNNTDVTVQLSGSDALSGLKHTYYKLNGGPQEGGTSVPINTEGTHTLDYWSVDKAGNAEVPKTVGVKIDKTKPSINHTQDPAANGNGWNNTNVTVTFTCKDDGGSGIASCTEPVTVTTEGEDQEVHGTATDNAGNTATDPATVSIDTAAPTISASADRDPNVNGWYNADVTVAFECDDGLSGIAVCPPAEKLDEGTNQSVSGSAIDAAGNSASATKSDINVDKTAPKLSGAAQGSASNGWYNADVTVAWSCSDAVSGLDGSCPADSTLTGEGDNLMTSASVGDRAGNSTNTTVGGIKIDRTAPTTSAKVPAAKYGLWHAGSVEITLEASDNLSQVDKSFYSLNGGASQSYAEPFSLSETATVTFWSVDNAGNVENKDAATQTITVQVDNTKPSIEASISPMAPDGRNGWYIVAPTVSFTCADGDGSGIDSCLADGGSGHLKELAEGKEGQTVSGKATDNVGNTAEATLTDIKVDLSDPSELNFVGGPAAGSEHPSGSDLTAPTCTAEDTASGVASCEVTGYSTAVGTHTLTATATDNAGRTATATRTYTIVASAPVPPPAENTAPTVTVTSPAEGTLFKLGDTIGIAANYTDAGSGHTCTITSDGATVASTVTSGSGGGTCTGNTKPSAAGVYNVVVEVTDAGGLKGKGTTYFVVYDPNAGFVTGGGWINSPAGAYSADPKLSGRANFGFVSKYQKGATAPTGQTEFHFQAAGFKFTSTSYEWLVVSGAKAQYKGAGTVNGQSGYQFLLTVTDGQVAGGGGTDKFRIKITGPNGVVYDNVPGAGDDPKTFDPQAIGGGSIVIHSK